MTMKKIPVDKGWLVYMYLNQYMSMGEIADIVECSGEHIRQNLIKYKIPRRSRREIDKLRRKPYRFCIDCGKRITGQKRCRSCENIHRSTEEGITHCKIKDPERCHKISRTLTGYKHSKETLHNMKVAANRPEVIEAKRHGLRIAYDHNDGELRRAKSDQLRRQHAAGIMLFTEAHCEKISKATKGREVDKETRQRLSKATKASWACGAMDNRAPCSKNPSSLEIAVAEYFDGAGITYIQQYRPEGMRKPFDFYLSDTNILLEVQGDYWHNLEGAHDRAKKKLEDATKLGYYVYEIWEHDIHNLGIEHTLCNALPQEFDLWKFDI